MHPDGLKILISEEKIQEKVHEIGESINNDYAGKEILVVGVLKGASVFLADLIRNIDLVLGIDFVAVSSYGASTKSSGVVRILKDLEDSIEGRHVIVVEDIVDTGLTLNYLVENFKARGPASVKVVTLLDKPARRKIHVPIHYNGFSIPDEFVVGYGLDYNEKYRNLPYVMVLKPEIGRN
ncbi:MAG TPA: hypoxanthine phosphoribosyltransferase [Clostridia bacterium]|nr:hypoxanthine phosphoribosyltransferase [Clostridia bacterium]